MSKQTDTSLFIVSSVPRLYQALLSGIKNYKELGNRIIKEIKLAQAFRQVEKVAELSQILVNNPIKEYQLIGQYYLLWCSYRTHQYDINALEEIIDQTQTYKAQTLLSRGAFEYDHRRNDTALYFFNEALKARPTISEYISISIAIAVAKSIEGFHDLALKDLEKLIPIIKYAEPKLYYDFLNSYAVELAEAGRKYEARNIIKPVLESPYIIAYPEWRETADEVKGTNRSFAVLNPTRRRRAAKILSMPAIEHAEPTEWHKPAPVISLESWKAKMSDKGDELDSRQLLLKVMELSTAPGMTDGKLLQVIQYMYKLLIDAPKPDDDNSGDEPGA